MKYRFNLNWQGGLPLLSLVSLLGLLPITAAIAASSQPLVPFPVAGRTVPPQSINFDRPAYQSQEIAQWRRASTQGGGRHSQRRPGGTRGEDCAVWHEGQYPTALIPREGTLFTTAERPTIWLYLPYATPNAVNFKLELRDSERQGPIEKSMIYQLNGFPKVVRLVLPALTTDKSYKWSFLEVCENNGQPKKSLLFSADIKRVSLEHPLPTLPTGMDAYRSQGLWLDAFNGVAELRMNNREQALWTQLLEEIDLGEIAPVPFAATVDPQ